MRKSNPFLYVFLIVGLAVCFANSLSGQSAGKSYQEIERLLQVRLDSLTGHKVVPGVTLAVRFHDGTAISMASGLADVEEHVAMKPGAVMFSGSVGKTYVAAAVLKLFEQGKIDLNAKAIEYLGEKDWFLKVPNAGEITVKMLLNHTAGIPEYVYHKELWQQISKDPDKIWSVDERLSFIYHDPPANEPGKGWAYADSHYLILGLIIEKVTGKTYYEVLNEMILKPYKLTNTFPSDKRTLPGLVSGYTALTDEFLLPHKVVNNNQYAFNPQLEWTGGGLVSTVSDLTLWASQLWGGNVLKPETKKLMLTPTPFATGLFEDAGYGLGCFIGETKGITYYGHTGFVPGYITYLQYLPDYDLAIAFQFNDDGSHSNFSMKSYFNRIKSIVLK